MTQTLSDAALTAAERRVLDRIVALARAEFGERLVAVWLYGSRARGEPPHEESDIDVLVIADDERAEQNFFSMDFGTQAGEPEGVSPVFVDVKVRSPRWLADRRQIESFFIQEVDRDKVVVYGRP